MLTPERIIELLGLTPLQGEGGYYAQTYRSLDTIGKEALPDRFGGHRAMATAIYFLVTNDRDGFSCMHTLPSDEIWHFYLGDPVQLLQLSPDGTGCEVILGQDIEGGQKLQHVIPRNAWQGARLIPGGVWALMGTTVSPGFEFRDFIPGKRAELVRLYPDFKDLIIELTREE